MPARVLLVVDSLEVGGAERHVTDLALALRGDGHAVAVACATGGALLAELEAAGIPVRVLMTSPVKRRIDCSYARRLRSLVLQTGCDVVHAHLYASAVAASLATAGTQSALVITVHSESSWQDAFARHVSGLVYRRADALIAVSSPIARQLLDCHHVPAERVRLISNALYESASIRGPVVLPPWQDGKVVGVVSRLCQEKGVDVFLDALSHLRPRHADLRGVVVGDGPLLNALRRRAQDLGLGTHVQFLGCRHDARGLIPSFDLLVVPSRTEGSPLVVLEAMTAGVAVVATRVGGVPDQIRDGRDGLLVAPDSPEALAEAIDLLLTHPVLRQELAHEGRRHVAQAFPYGAVLERVERVYASALLERRARAPIQPEPSWK